VASVNTHTKCIVDQKELASIKGNQDCDLVTYRPWPAKMHKLPLKPPTMV
jgi:hypothetical protein